MTCLSNKCSVSDKYWWEGVGAGPNERSVRDMSHQQKLCPVCSYRENFSNKSFSSNCQKQGLEKSRTQFDKNLQRTWCPLK
jgi:hypothetical protein